MNVPSLNSLSLKLLIPLVLCGAGTITLIFIVTHLQSGITREQHVRQQAIEFSESFLIATEVNSSRSSIIRTTNSLGTYQGIEEIFIIEEQSQRIIAANQNRYVGAPVSKLPEFYRSTGWEQVLRYGGSLFNRADGDNYVYAYRARILSEDKTSTVSIVILMLLTPATISTFLDEFTDAAILFSTLAFLGALFIFYLILKLTLLKRIERIVNVIEEDSDDSLPRLCPVESNDELGILVTAYNKSLISDHEHKMQLITANLELSKLSHYDPLTGVSNRRNFDRVLDDEWKRGARHQQPMALLMIDVDHFKQFNDQHGHMAGDVCLKAVAITLEQQLKRAGDLLSRYGGEEFCIILPNTADGGSIVAESCRTAIENLPIEVAPESPPVHVTISIGVAYAIPQADHPPKSLLELADKALYQAKQSGRNRVASFGAAGAEAA
ncbi:MAG: diguanylate cyclase [Betaproteobacteria bacterium]|nr:MAG: diguanylate cyclase [Betaproteobacteria bacterium]